MPGILTIYCRTDAETTGRLRKAFEFTLAKVPRWQRPRPLIRLHDGTTNIHGTLRKRRRNGR